MRPCEAEVSFAINRFAQAAGDYAEPLNSEPVIHEPQDPPAFLNFASCSSK